MLSSCLLQSVEFTAFDPGGLGTMARMAAVLAPAFLILTVVVHVLVAWYIYCAAVRLADEGHGPALFPPFLWGIASLVGIFVVPFAFAVIHYATWFEPEEDVPWSRRRSRPRGGMMAEATELHRQRVAELREDLAAARGAHRRRYIRSELRKLEKDGPRSMSDGENGGDGPRSGPRED